MCLRFKRELDCDLQQLKGTVIIEQKGEGQSIVDTIEPNLWESCKINVNLHRMMLAKGIRKLKGLWVRKLNFEDHQKKQRTKKQHASLLRTCPKHDMFFLVFCFVCFNSQWDKRSTFNKDSTSWRSENRGYRWPQNRGILLRFTSWPMFSSDGSSWCAQTRSRKGSNLWDWQTFRETANKR